MEMLTWMEPVEAVAREDEEDEEVEEVEQDAEVRVGIEPLPAGELVVETWTWMAVT